MARFDLPDDETWDAYKRQVKPLKGRERLLKPEVKKLPKTRDVIISKKEDVTPLKVQAQPLPAKRVRKLRRHEITIDASIDLHGMTLARAHTVLTGFVKKAITQGLHCIEVVTGKGDPLRGTGKIRREVPLWLQETTIKTHILHVEESHITRGGSYLVLLRKAKKRG